MDMVDFLTGPFLPQSHSESQLLISGPLLFYAMFTEATDMLFVLHSQAHNDL